jgi:hypothetical protein
MFNHGTPTKRGRLSSVDLPIRVAHFVKKWKIIFSISKEADQN